MKDRNGIEIRTGDVVRVSRAYFKCDNGLWFVECSPGDISWCGSYHSLHKISKSGKISTANRSVSSWPLMSYVSDRMKSALANEWNKANAEIEIVHGIDRTEITAHFRELASGCDERHKREVWNWGEDSKWAKLELDMKDHFLRVADRTE